MTATTRFGLATRWLATLSVGLSLSVVGGSARAEDGGAATGFGAAPLVKGPRTVDVILADIAHALGSDAAWKAHKNVKMKLETAFQGMGINGTIERFAT